MSGPPPLSALGQSLCLSALGDEATGPQVLVQRVLVHEEAVRLVAETRLTSGQLDAGCGTLLRGEDPEDLGVVAVFLVPRETSILVSVLGRRAIEVGSVMDVPDHEDDHARDPRPAA